MINLSGMYLLVSPEIVDTADVPDPSITPPPAGSENGIFLPYISNQQTSATGLRQRRTRATPTPQERVFLPMLNQ